jgi:hypothetical protein
VIRPLLLRVAERSPWLAIGAFLVLGVVGVLALYLVISHSYAASFRLAGGSAFELTPPPPRVK